MDDRGFKSRVYSRMINEIIKNEKKLENILENRMDLTRSAKKFDFEVINKKLDYTQKLLKLFESDFLAEEEKVNYDTLIDVCYVLSPNLAILEKRQIIEKLFTNEYNLIKAHDLFDELERDNLNITFADLPDIHHYDEKQVIAIVKFFSKCAKNSENFNYCKNQMKILESEHEIIDSSLPSFLLNTLNDKFFYIVDKKTKNSLFEKLSIEIPLNPYLYDELYKLFSMLKEKLNFKSYSHLYVFLLTLNNQN
ncbi:MAG: hypothetical protein QXF76_02860 [Candidatus Anstonellales archaeon]